MTQLESAISGRITDEMKIVAESENIDPKRLKEEIAAGRVVIPKNIGHAFTPKGVGKGLCTKINANIGTSPSHCDIDEELNKLDVAVSAGADAVMDLSTGGDLDRTLAAILDHSPVMIGTVPIYKAMSRVLCANRKCPEMTEAELFSEIESQGKAGVDFITVHCGITRHSMKILESCDRMMGMVSRGGSLLAEWIVENDQENPLYEKFDRLLEIARAYDMTLSLGDGLRPGSIFDAQDRAQVTELVILGELAARSRAAGVQVMIEGPGHVPLGRIAGDMKLQQRICGQAPYYVLGPLPTDIGAGHDHITGAIGGAIAAANGADFLCYVTPAEHLSLPDVNDVREGVIASKIAAHIGDLEKGIASAWKQDRKMSQARKRLDWKTMIETAIDSEKALRMRDKSEDKDRDVCTMCGDFCAIKTYERATSHTKLDK
ncbi:MAG: phosphomethylpyrimidine synthase ThiC [Deltaproteobacteria bacterium]|nr:phosphomethylpyrimidine synthase ThiC [Deltaproteobacteria bacterium]